LSALTTDSVLVDRLCLRRVLILNKIERAEKMDIPKLLFEWEVAERLRCSTSKVKRLRLSGQLAYIPGRPLLISEADLLAYLERARRKEIEKRGPEPGSPEAEAKMVADARGWAQRKALKRRWREESKRSRTADVSSRLFKK
jgi:hypothetical protein